jgi:hypothetical protein
MIDPFWHPAKAPPNGRHIDLCSLLDVAKAVIARRDYVAADRTRNRAFRAHEPLAWFVGEQIGMWIAEARADDRRSSVDDLMRIAS